VNLVTFYSNKIEYRLASIRLFRQATKINLFPNKFFYNEKKIFEVISSKYKNNLGNFIVAKEAQGFIYYAWKPIIILECLKKMKDNENLLYCDVGCNILNDEYAWKKLLDKVKKHKIVLSYSQGYHQRSFGSEEYKWTKPEVFKALRVKASDRKSSQYQATWILIVNNSKNRKLIKAWEQRCTNNNFFLLKPNESNSPSGSSLIYHAYDQAILSCLLKSRSYKPAIANLSDMHVIQAARNRSLFSFYGGNISIFQKIIKKNERIIILVSRIFIN
jgi:hypothetical protein